METRATTATARALFQRAMGMLWRWWRSFGRAHRLPTRVGLLAVVVLTGVLTPLVPVVLGAAPRAHAAPATPPVGPAPAGAVPFSRQPAPTLPIGTWQPRTPPASPATGATGATKQRQTGSPAAGRTPGEQMDLRTVNSQTFLNADG